MTVTVRPGPIDRGGGGRELRRVQAAEQLPARGVAGEPAAAHLVHLRRPARRGGRQVVGGGFRGPHAARQHRWAARVAGAIDWACATAAANTAATASAATACQAHVPRARPRVACRSRPPAAAA